MNCSRSAPSITPDEARHAAELLELGDAFFELDRAWRIIRVNRTLEERSGMHRAELLGRPVVEVWPELATPASRFQHECGRCMMERVPVQFQVHLAPLVLWAGVTAYPIDGGGIAVFFRDITAVKEAEREHARLAAIVEGTDDAIISKDLDGTIITWNAGAERLFGYPAHEVIGRPITILMPGERLDEERRILAELRAGRRVDHFETRRVRKDGSVVEVSVTASPIRGEDGEVIGASKIARDITERSRSARALSASEEKFRSVVENAAVGVGRVSLDGRFIEVNQAYADIVGYSREELLALDFQSITHPDDLAIDEGRLRELAAGRARTYRMEKRYVRKDGGIVWVSLSVGLGHDQEGKPAYCAVVVEDVTQRRCAGEALREANERLREADRRKNDFLGMLSHELRNPLAPIRNSLFILDRAEPTGEGTRRARDVIGRQVVHLTRLVDDLLDVTRVARGKIELRRTDLDLAALVHRTGEDYRALMHSRGLELAVEVPREPVVVNGDEVRLAQVLGNLLSNAAKFTQVAGRVTVGVEARQGQAVVRVCDTGPGIAPDVLPTIFEPFTQAEQTLARSEGGLGLGLALVRGLVSLHGGEVKAVSGSGGTEFIVTLPLAWRQDYRAAPPAGPKAEAPAAHRRVLVVDDNEDAADTLAEMVRTLGHDAEVAYDGAAAVRRAGECRPDVVLCDIGLPVMDGYAVAHELRARHGRDIRLVAVSGYAQPDDVTRAAEAGFDEHVAKPCGPEQIERLLT